MTSVLISGASIAGPTLAYWLRRHGYAVTVVERTPALRLGGQPIDIRGVARQVVARMGLEDQVVARRTRSTGVNVLDRSGNEIVRHTDRTLSAGRHDSGDVEIFRDDLSALLYEATKSDVDYCFGDSIAAIEDGGGKVTVSFDRGRTRDFDLVIGADGIYSAVRRLVFGPSEQFLKYLNAYVAIFTVENFLQLQDWQTAIGDLESRRGMLILPTLDNAELRVFMMFESEPLGRDLTTEQQKALLVERFAGFGWEVPRLLNLLRTASGLYFGEIAQIHMPRWSRGRVSLVGDAGYCPSPRSGQGTSLALVGGYILAGELALSRGEPAAAFSRYEERMRDFVNINQALVRGFGERVPDEEMARAKNAIELPLYQA